MSCIEQYLCEIRNLLSNSNSRETRIISFTIPENPTVAVQTRTFGIGDTKIDFRSGTIINPDGTIEKLAHSLETYNRELQREVKLRSLTIDTSADIILTVRAQPEWKWVLTSGYREITSFVEYHEIIITTTQSTAIKLFACTNPEATIFNFSKTVVTTLEQDVITGDATEATTWDAISSLKSNLNRIRNQIITITGEAWGTVSNSISTIWAKFNATTGHTHDATANNGPKITWANINKATSSIADITTKSHTALTDIGTNTHAQIDTAIGTTLPGLVTTHAAVTETHGATGAIVGTTNEQTLLSKTYRLTNTPTDGIASGIVVNDNAGENLVFGNFVYLKSDGKWYKSDADASTTMPIGAMATGTIAADATGLMLLYGTVRNTAWSWTIGGFLYADTTTAGGLTQTAPSGTGDQVQIVGIATGATVILFNPSYDIVEIV